MQYRAYSFGMLCLVLTTACSADMFTPKLDAAADDSVQVAVHSAADATVDDLAAFASTSSMVGWDVIPAHGPTLNFSLADASTDWAAGCSRNANTGRFDCALETSNGLTLTRSFAFYDANGGIMLGFNDSTTASLNVRLTEAGVRAAASAADTISRFRDLTVTGLLGHNTTRIWNGSGVRTDGGYYNDDAAARTYHVRDTTVFTNIVVQLPRTLHLWPEAGSISRKVVGTGTATRNGTSVTLSVSRTVTVTFNGTEFVPLTIGDETYSLDLATGKVTKP